VDVGLAQGNRNLPIGQSNKADAECNNIMKKRLPPKLLLLSIAVSVISHYLFPVLYFIGFPTNLFGFLIVGIGWILCIWSQNVIESHGTAMHCQKKPTMLVTTGPFRFSRNPFYLGYLIITVGVAIMLGSISGFVGPLLFVVLINSKVIPKEENILQQIFSESYTKYRQEVRRWL
jgi:protein-S-isoprenylcysteine O-methyltransferase Ste14